MASAKENRKAGHNQRDVERRIAKPGIGLPLGAGDYIKADRDRLKLQGDIGDHPNQAD